MRARYLVVCGLIGVASPLSAQDSDAWRTHFAAAEEARTAGDVATYSSEAAAAATTIPTGLLNRPFVQYHAARAAALNGAVDEAAAWLQMAWDERIEALMISFAMYDPAFAEMRASEPFVRVMALASEMRLSVRRLGGDVYLIDGAGANVLAQVSDEGVFLVDTGYRPALSALRAALSTLGADDVTTLLITHPHEDHMGSTPDLGAEATVFAHPGTAAEMRKPYVFMEGVTVPPKPLDALPDVEVAADTTIVRGGESVRIVPTVAHSAGDLSVYFSEARVAHLGDAYLGGNPMMFPGGDDPDAFLDRFSSFLDEMHPETIVVGGHEATTDLDAVRSQIAATRACMTFVRASIDGGLSLEETAASGAGRFAPQWVSYFYRLFTQ